MAAKPRHPYARHIRAELSRDGIDLSGQMLDVVSHAMAIVSTIAMSTRRNVMLLNVGNAFSIPGAFRDGEELRSLDRIEADLSKTLEATGQCLVSKRKDRRAARASEILGEVLDAATDAGVEGAFLVQAMDDGHVRLQLGPDASGTCPLSRFVHSEDAPMKG